MVAYSSDIKGGICHLFIGTNTEPALSLLYYMQVILAQLKVAPLNVNSRLLVGYKLTQNQISLGSISLLTLYTITAAVN